ncbi:hypothetical protein BGY98DRAFT_376860 [Russula aff. rugulosa BPL654]|nr:hypothetical protein BGY98DRAFT_376860 [Russula aff. rugulosa BPL654]
MGKSRGKKRKAHESAIATSIQGVDLPPWIQQLLIKKARKDLPSFSAAKWSEVAPQFGLSDYLTTVQFDSYPITPVLLPRLFMRLSPRRHGASKTSIKNDLLSRGKRSGY